MSERRASFAERCGVDVVEAMRRAGTSRIDRKDLLHGLLQADDSRAVRLLQAVGVEPYEVDAGLGAREEEDADEGLMSPQLLLTIDFAAAEACRESKDEIDSGHLLVALARGTRAGHDLHREPLLAAARLVFGWRDGKVSFWDLLADRGPLTRDAERPVYCVTADPKWRHVAAGCADGRIDVWDLEQGIYVRYPEGHKGPVRAVAWCPNSARVLTGSEDGTAAVWDTERGTKVLELVGHDGPVRTVAFNPQGELCYTGSDDGTIKVWYGRTGALVDTLEEHRAGVVRLGFVEPRVPLVSRSQDDIAILWTDPPQHHIAPEDDLVPILARFALTADTLRTHLARA